MELCEGSISSVTVYTNVLPYCTHSAAWFLRPAPSWLIQSNVVFFFLFFLELCANTDLAQGQIVRVVYLTVRIFSYLYFPSSSVEMYVYDRNRTCLTFFFAPLNTHLCEGFPLCLGVFIHARTQRVCVVAVCVLREEFMLFAVNTAHNGALKSEPPPGPGKWRAPPASNDYSPLPSGPKVSRSDWDKECDWSELTPKNNQINSFCSLWAMTACQLFEEFSWKTRGKSVLIFFRGKERVVFALQYVSTWV